MADFFNMAPPGYVAANGIPVPAGWGSPNRDPPPPAPLRPQAGFGPGIDECLCALQDMLEGVLTVGDLAPHIHPPFDSISLEPFARSVINVPAALDAVANAAGIALAAAEGQFQAVTLLTPVNAVTPEAQIVLNFTCPQGFVAVFRSWGVTVELGDPTAAFMSVTAQGPNNSSSPPNPLASGAADFEQQRTMIIIPENKSFTIKVQNLDTGAPLLVSAAANGWQLPVRRFEDTLKSMLKKQGYDTTCQEPCS